MASENQFTVDLGTMKLSDQDRAEINLAIQKAVASQLGGLSRTGKIVLIPVNKWTLGGIINGLYIRPIDEKILKEVIR